MKSKINSIKNLKISILLPYKENFSSEYAGAVSLLLKDTISISKFKNNIKIFGSTKFKQDILKDKYINLKIDNFFFQSKSKIYLKKFIDHEQKFNSDIIEIHNRPNYLDYIFNFNKNLVLFFHNDPLLMKGSKSLTDRLNVLKKTKKVVFISKWVMKRFLTGFKKKDLPKNHFEIIYHSTNKKKINFNKKNKIILFVGRLNESKGYDIFTKAIVNILNFYPEWKAVVIGDEPREKIFVKHKNLIQLGFKKNKTVTNWFIKSDICVVCSKWDEPFGRTALEASSAGCAVIISNKGGLPEASPKAIKLKYLNPKYLENRLKKLINDKKYKISIQKKIYNHFFLTNKHSSNTIDKLRNSIIKI